LGTIKYKFLSKNVN